MFHVNDGEGATGDSLNVDTAVPVFESWLSEQEHKPDTETPPAPKTPEPVVTEPADVEASTEPAETDEVESEATDENAETPPEEPNQIFRTKVNGEEVEVTLDELLKGYSRTSDYTRKTQEIAAQRKAQEAEFAAVREERQKYAANLTQLEQALQDATPQEPDWARLQQENPADFPAQWALWSAHKERMTAIRQEREQAQQSVQQDQVQSRQSHIEAERSRLLEVIPEWKNPETAKAEKTKLVAFAQTLGYTAEELAQVVDHRPLVMLRKAMLWDEAQKAKPVIRQKIERVTTARPGPANGVARPPVTDETRALQRLAKTGRQEDAAAAFLHMFGGE